MSKTSLKTELPKVDKFVDCKGFLCPIPTLRARKYLAEIETGEVLCLEATDKKSILDMPKFCEEQGHNYLLCQQIGDVIMHFIKKA
ncbi:MAG: hypothetical protein CMP22_06175 [Rickettsiales bacterium]|nr:hypothetical protein [Rickettsiales bacterium]|tara:strand:- start:333 stop:590 length:258 start_codon:yes stop_codon:yes gene_type:complete